MALCYPFTYLPTYLPRPMHAPCGLYHFALIQTDNHPGLSIAWSAGWWSIYMLNWPSETLERQLANFRVRIVVNNGHLW